ncbi:MAG: hypothetical protein K9J16_04500 [Melioribacteraceae bacterium]|nr:hypothetical protein [Melioribacteraceae bacterium]MCF8354749.1 hypothetical protein [Melioribacteraceae bacterium]MCF8393229.1 hypothetical protein [Melioribacteraceae bacterium]MCF8417530.1 hypothetical protein [Melioribacteraceae bacterium]
MDFRICEFVILRICGFTNLPAAGRSSDLRIDAFETFGLVDSWIGGWLDLWIEGC